MSDRPSRSELEAELARTRADLAAERTTGKEDPNRRTASTAIVVALITGVLAFGPPLLAHDDPLVTNCIEQRAAAISSIEETGVWTDLPDDSTSEEECAINEYVVDWQDQNKPATPPAGE